MELWDVLNEGHWNILGRVFWYGRNKELKEPLKRALFVATLGSQNLHPFLSVVK